MSTRYFVSGIDTNIGKSYATGYLAKLWNTEGHRTITQKFIQTGNCTVSEDILLHRQIMGIPLLDIDTNSTTMPEIFSYPCSPHLASEIDDREIDFSRIEQATQSLSATYDRVLIEGAGGLMVPLTRHMTTLDYIEEHNLPVILVTCGRLGSINHTLLSLEALRHRNIPLHTLVYNHFHDSEDSIISADSHQYIKNCTQRLFPQVQFLDLPVLSL